MPQKLDDYMKERGLGTVRVTFSMCCGRCGGTSFTGTVATDPADSVGMTCDVCGSPPGPFERETGAEHG